MELQLVQLVAEPEQFVQGSWQLLQTPLLLYFVSSHSHLFSMPTKGLKLALHAVHWSSSPPEHSWHEEWH